MKGYAATVSAHRTFGFGGVEQCQFLGVDNFASSDEAVGFIIRKAREWCDKQEEDGWEIGNPLTAAFDTEGEQEKLK